MSRINEYKIDKYKIDKTRIDKYKYLVILLKDTSVAI